MRRHPLCRYASILLVAFGVCHGPAWGQAPERKPAPDAAAQAAAEKSIKDLFKKEYAKAGTAPKVQLAALLLDAGLKTNDDPAARFVLFREAADVAAQVGDARILLAALDAMAKDFQVNGLEMKCMALEVAAKFNNATAGYGAIARGALHVLEQEAIATNEYAAAAQLVRVLTSVGERSSNKQMTSIVQDLPREIEELKNEYEAASPSI